MKSHRALLGALAVMALALAPACRNTGEQDSRQSAEKPRQSPDVKQKAEAIAETVAVRVGFDDNRGLGDKETGGRTALPIFREIMLRVYAEKLVGTVPQFPREIEEGIDNYLGSQAALEAGEERLDAGAMPEPPDAPPRAAPP